VTCRPFGAGQAGTGLGPGFIRVACGGGLFDHFTGFSAFVLVAKAPVEPAVQQTEDSYGNNSQRSLHSRLFLMFVKKFGGLYISQAANSMVFSLKALVWPVSKPFGRRYFPSRLDFRGKDG
jgi:hypothetical protein